MALLHGCLKVTYCTPPAFFLFLFFSRQSSPVRKRSNSANLDQSRYRRRSRGHPIEQNTTAHCRKADFIPENERQPSSISGTPHPSISFTTLPACRHVQLCSRAKELNQAIPPRPIGAAMSQMLTFPSINIAHCDFLAANCAGLCGRPVLFRAQLLCVSATL